MLLDPEVQAMNEALKVFAGLDHNQRKRIVDWLSARFYLTELKPPEAAEAPEADAEPVEAVEVVETEAAVVVEEAPVVEVPPAPPKDDFESYETLKEVINASSAKKVVDRILLAAAFLQETNAVKELTSYQINSRLKKAGFGIPNISIALNRLLDKVPQVLTAKREGTTKQARRRFTVTEDGVEVAKKFLR